MSQFTPTPTASVQSSSTVDSELTLVLGDPEKFPTTKAQGENGDRKPFFYRLIDFVRLPRNRVPANDRQNAESKSDIPDQVSPKKNAMSRLLDHFRPEQPLGPSPSFSKSLKAILRHSCTCRACLNFPQPVC